VFTDTSLGAVRYTEERADPKYQMNVSQLVNMGFSDSDALAALKACSNNFDQALDMLLNGGVSKVGAFHLFATEECRTSIIMHRVCLLLPRVEVATLSLDL
jgi:hypothetical protein